MIHGSVVADPLKNCLYFSLGNLLYRKTQRQQNGLVQMKYLCRTLASNNYDYCYDPDEVCLKGFGRFPEKQKIKLTSFLEKQSNFLKKLIKTKVRC